MGKFIDTRYKDTIDNLVTIHDDLIRNPFYPYNDKKGTLVKYYNMNMEKTTVDPGSKLAYTDIGDKSPIRFNIIHDLFLYQFNRVELNLENDEFGMEGQEITGESYILPNTITPYEGDYFEVKHVKDSTWLFKVTDVQRDTLENGANVYKINWLLDRTNNREILKNVVEEFQYRNVQAGSNTRAVVLMSKYKMAEQLDQIGETIRNYFVDLFYSGKVQTFIFLMFNNSNIYDPFSIEFMIRNKLLEAPSDEYIFVEHKIQMWNTFAIEYDKSFFRAFELRDIGKLKTAICQSQAVFIDDPTSIFRTRYEEYFCMDYKVYSTEINAFNPRSVIPMIDEDLVEHIVEEKYYDECCQKYKNIFVKYFNKKDIYQSDIEAIQYIDFEYSKDIYYQSLLLLFCIEFYTKSLLS